MCLPETPRYYSLAELARTMNIARSHLEHLVEGGDVFVRVMDNVTYIHRDEACELIRRMVADTDELRRRFRIHDAIRDAVFEDLLED